MPETFKRHDFDSNKTTDNGNLSKPFLAFVAWSPGSPYHLHPTCEDLVGPPFLHALHKVYLESPDTTGRCVAVGTSVVMPSN